uniref:Wunen-like protein 2 n=1 Tax=Heliconius melpomene TaxID=34740 RepID=A0A517BE10_HELME|nr:wunen-like protein 2 [Heliconius melpomene]
MGLDCVSVNITSSREVFAGSVPSLNEPRRDLELQGEKNENESKHKICWALGVDLPLFLLVSVIIILFELGVIPHYKSGFYCNDPALSFPFTGDTVSMGVILSTIILLPFVMVFLTELLLFDSSYSIRIKLDYTARRTAILYRNYVYGMFFNLGIVEVMKAITGSPRPTFFDICEPDAAKTCNGSEYVSTFECTSTRFPIWYQTDSYHSFPSGHTSLSVYCGMFIAWYLQRRAFSWHNRTVLLVPILQLLCLAYAAICSLTRITDHRHHWWDVLVGAAIGLATGFYAILVISKNFNVKPNSIEDKTMTESQHTVRTLVFDGPQLPVP